jgi:hypothetical protein
LESAGREDGGGRDVSGMPSAPFADDGRQHHTRQR